MKELKILEKKYRLHDNTAVEFAIYRFALWSLNSQYDTTWLMDGWMTRDITSFLTVFQSYQDDVWMIMKGCVQWNSVYGWEDFTSSEDRTRSPRSVGQRLTHELLGLPTTWLKYVLKFYAQMLSS